MLRPFAGKSPIVPESCYIDPSAQVRNYVEYAEQYLREARDRASTSQPAVPD